MALIKIQENKPIELKGLKYNFQFYWLNIYILKNNNQKILYIYNRELKLWIVWLLEEDSSIQLKNAIFKELKGKTKIKTKKGIREVFILGYKENLSHSELLLLEFSNKLYSLGYLKQVGYMENILK